MTNSIIELHTQVPADLEGNVFGQFDEHLKLSERTLNVTLISRDGSLKILGTDGSATQAKKLIEELVTLAGKGNTITRQNVTYALSLAMEERNQVLTEIDKDFICNTIQGRPIKPKTLGQKEYVEQIRKKMIVFGIGPAGTGKTSLAMAMAVSGVYMLSGGNTPGGSINIKGLMLVLATVIAYAAYIVGMNRSRIARLDSLKATFYILLSGAIVFLVNLAIKGDFPDPMPNLGTTIDVLMVAFLPTLVSDLTLILAIRYIGSTTTAILGCMEPLTAVCMGVLFLGEHLQPMQIGGIVVVLSAVCIVISGSYIRKWVRDIRLLFMHRI